MREVDTALFKEFSLETYQLLMENFDNGNKWINVSPTLHALFSHSWKLIEANNRHGLGNTQKGPGEK